ncbi:MAG: hypothetical protein Q7S66_05410 [bacterium]|nr:hypothetical protein [bacterium]
MKTILVTIFHGAAAKNILRTGVMKTLLRPPDVRVVCLMRFSDRADSYRVEIPHERVVYDTFYKTPSGALERFFSFMKYRLIRTATTDLRHEISFDKHRSYALYGAAVFLNFIVARPVIRKALRFLDYYFIGDPGFGGILEKYKPDAVFITHLFDDGEISLLREAKKRRIPAIGFINSWDKLTARCSIRLLPDKLIVFNDIVKGEAEEYADMPASRIAVCGIPQYDQYVTDKPTPRGEFFKKIGIDPKKSLILYSPRGIVFSASDWAVIDFLHDSIVRGEIGEADMLVRFPPNDFLDESELSKRPWLKYDLPGRRFGIKRSVDWDMDFEELKHLTNSLAHASLIVGYTSSIAIDAAVFDKPIIGINFEICDNLPLVASPTAYYRTEHFSKALRAGGIRQVGSKQEFLEAIKAYLCDPLLDRAGRRRLAEEQCWRLDGKSGERIAEAILEKLRK